MKLISCHIRNFGCLSEQDITFDSNIHKINNPNGHGKSTLAAFLKAMLYGLKTYKDSDKEMGDRKHYYPFNGGVYGGSLTCESNGITYVIERTFDFKSATKDKVQVYVNGKQYNLNNDEIGFTIFGIDKESFERTILISSNDIEVKPKEGIINKLANFAQGASDTNSAKSATDKIDKNIKEHSKAIKEKNSQIKRNKDTLRNLNDVEIGLKAKYQTLGDLSIKEKEIQTEQDSLADNELLLKDWEQYEKQLKAIDDDQQVIDFLDSKYSKGIPTTEEVTSFKNAYHTLKTSNLSITTLNNEQQIRLNTLKEKYDGKIPSEEELNSTSTKLNKLDFCDEEISKLTNETISAEDKKLIDKFDKLDTTSETLNKINETYDEYCKTEHEYSSISEWNTQVQTNLPSLHKNKPTLFICSAIVSALIIVAGIILIIFYLIPGVILTVAGFLALIIIGFIYLSKKTSPVSVTPIQTPNPEKTEKQKYLNNLETKLRQYFLPYLENYDADINICKKNLDSQIQQFKKIKEAEHKKEEQIKKYEEEKQGIINFLVSFLTSFDFNGKTYKDDFSKLKSEFDELKLLSKLEADYKTTNQRVSKANEEMRETINTFASKYGLYANSLDEIEKDLADDSYTYYSRKKDIETNKQKAEQFKKDRNLTDKPKVIDTSKKEEIRNKFNNIKQQISDLKSDIDNDEAMTLDIGDIKNQNTLIREEIDKLDYENRILEKIKEHIKKADDAIKEKYIIPISNNYKTYANMVEKSLGEEIELAPDLKIEIKRDGINRAEEHLSSGEKSIAAFALRLALLDNIYQHEKPFLILDDPFVALDENHLSHIKDLLTDISSKFQLLYFTCHDSRSF